MSDNIEARDPVGQGKAGVAVSLLGCALLSLAMVLAVILFPYEKAGEVFPKVLAWLIERGAALGNWAYAQPGWLFGPLIFAFLFCFCAAQKKDLGVKLNERFDSAGVIVFVVLLSAFIGYGFFGVLEAR